MGQIGGQVAPLAIYEHPRVSPTRVRARDPPPHHANARAGGPRAGGAGRGGAARGAHATLHTRGTYAIRSTLSTPLRPVYPACVEVHNNLYPVSIFASILCPPRDSPRSRSGRRAARTGRASRRGPSVRWGPSRGAPGGRGPRRRPSAASRACHRARLR